MDEAATDTDEAAPPLQGERRAGKRKRVTIGAGRTVRSGRRDRV